MRNCESLDVGTQTVAAVVTRQAARREQPQVKPLNVISISQVINRKQVREEQKSDPTLSHIYELMEERTVKKNKKGVETMFVTERGRLYRRVVLPGGGVQLQFVVPSQYRATVIKLGHESPLAGHMGKTKTLDRIKATFFWPGMGKDVELFTRSCDVCQRTTDKGRVKPAPLTPLPVISEPFERVAVDIVGPFMPRSSEGYKYILTIVDFSTRWPEAVALKNIEAPTVAEALVEVFCRVGIPRQVLSDRGSQFTSAMMDEVLRLLAVKGLRTTPYHPQCNGLCERFNGTLKKMLRRMAAEQPKEWPRFVAPLLFAYREAPQQSLKFSPFELVYGRRARGPLQVLRELWEGEEEEEGETKSTYGYVLDLAERLEATCKVAREELTKAQEVQKSYFDRRAKLRVFNAGEKCLILLPTSYNKLLAQWKGPFTVKERVSPVNYLVDVNGRTKRFHINMLKKYYTQDVVAGVQDKLHRRTQEQMQCLRLVTKTFAENHEKCVCSATVISDPQEGECGPVTPVTSQEETHRDVQVGPELAGRDWLEVKKLLGKYGDIFSDRPKIANVPPHEIELTNHVPVRVKPYAIPLKMMEAVKKEIGDMEAAGVIERSTSNYCNPMVLVKKKDGAVRICGDYRKLNAVTRFIAEPMPETKLVFARLAKSKYFSKLDLTKGYFQVPLEEKSRKVTAFSTPWGLYQYRALPFGLVNSPAVFNRAMREILRDVEGVEVFVDDILIHSATMERHLELLDHVFKKLRAANMTIKPSKCEVGQKVVKFLGHVIGKGECRCTEDKVEKIMSAPQPVTKKQVRSFLGMTEYYRAFIPNYAVVAMPLHELTRKRAPNKVVWEKEQQVAFECLKRCLSRQPILQLPDVTKEFVLRTDASQEGLGAVLLQEYDGKMYPVAYHSRKLKAAERNYSTVEKECLAVVDGIKKFYIYLFGSPFTLETDHMPLANLRPSKTANARLTRWALYLQQFSLRIKYIRGRENIGADLLSRLLEGPTVAD